MKTLFSSTLSRIFLASILPFIVAFSVILLVVANIIYTQSDERVRTSVMLTAQNASEKFSDSLRNFTGLVELTSMNMANLVVGSASPNTQREAEKLIYSLMETNSGIYCSWFVLSHDATGGADQADAKKQWHSRFYLRRDNKGVESFLLTEEELNDPKIADWHIEPFRTGKPFQDTGNYWDYRFGDGPEYIATIAYPVIRDDRVIGSVGVDVAYKNVFDFLDTLQIPGERRMLLLTNEKRIVYSPDDGERGSIYHKLGFRPKDLEDIDAVLTGGPAILKEIHSPVFSDASLVHVGPVNVPGMNKKLYLYVDTPTRVLYRQTHSTLALLAGLGLACLLVLAAAAILATRTIVEPLRRITESANHIANGNLDANREAIDRNDNASYEVTLLRESLRKMLDQISQTHELKMLAMQAEFDRNKMEETAKLRNQFFANMSHEIRTPMNAIIGISDILLGEDLTPALRKQIGSIKTASESLLAIINDILDISKLESGKMSLVNSHFDFDLMLENVSSICHHLASQKGLEFVMTCHRDVPHCLYGDEVRIRQILLNLLGNAVKFTAKGSVTLDVCRESNMIRFDITDTGIGIREEDKSSLFQTFKQVDQNKNRAIKGTGLGLAISMDLALIMGGGITVDSIYGKGTCFHVRILFAQGDPDKVETHEKDAASDFKISARALVVDDNELNLAVAVGLMRMFGLECDTASSGREAIEKAWANQYDIIFMDHMMPEMDGVEATREIRALGGVFTTLPIIALTANAMNGVRELLFDASMNDYLAKPIQKRVLRNILAKWLSKEKRQDVTSAAESARLLKNILGGAKTMPGLDVASAMEMIGDVALYRNLLKMAGEKIPDILAQLSTGLAAEDWHRLQIEVHSIKSSFASIGAMDLSRMAENMEHALATGDRDAYRDLAPEFMEHLERFGEDLRALF